jgi:hypothetical protein
MFSVIGLVELVEMPPVHVSPPGLNVPVVWAGSPVQAKVIGSVAGENASGDPVPFTLMVTDAVPPAAKEKFVVGALRVNAWLVAVTVRLKGAVCDAPLVPLAVPETLMVWTPDGTVIFAAVERVTWTV